MIKHKLTLEQRIAKLERLLIKNENVQFSLFDCDHLESLVYSKLGNIDCDVDINDDNADYGFINVGINCDGQIADYDIEALEYNKFRVTTDDKDLKTCNSINDIAITIAKAFKDFLL